MNNKEYLQNGLEKLNITPTDSQIDLMLRFMDIVLEENKKFNLTAIKEKADFIEKHLIDSAVIIPVLNKLNFSTLLDIGSGAGFPGIIIAIFFRDKSINLLDSTNKKVKFMTYAAKELELNNVSAISARAEDLKTRNEYNNKLYDVTTARAVSSLNILSELALPLTKTGGTFLAMKAAGANEELKEAKNAINTLGGKYIKSEKINLPYSNAERSIIEIKKVKQTPSTFPRKYSSIKKQPL